MQIRLQTKHRTLEPNVLLSRLINVEQKLREICSNKLFRLRNLTRKWLTTKLR